MAVETRRNWTKSYLLKQLKECRSHLEHAERLMKSAKGEVDTVEKLIESLDRSRVNIVASSRVARNGVLPKRYQDKLKTIQEKVDGLMQDLTEYRRPDLVAKRKKSKEVPHGP